MPVATQKTDTGLTQGLLKVLHKQVGEPLNCTRSCSHAVTLETDTCPLSPGLSCHIHIRLCFLERTPRASFSCIDFTFIL